MRPKQSPEIKGSAKVKEFYDNVGWELHESGKTVDRHLFGSHTSGNLQDNAYLLRVKRIRDVFSQAANVDHLLECGGGGNPGTFLSDLFRTHTLLDFSNAGLSSGLQVLRGENVAATAVQGDMCSLPFPSESFDAAYSANAIFHIPEAAGQKKAFEEILRVVRVGGVAVFLLANSRPLAFPMRSAIRMIADTPGLSTVVNKLRPPPPLPYRLMSLRWMRRCLEPFGDVETTGYAMASTWFQQHVPEQGLGKLLWQGLLRTERDYPHLSAYLGTYITVVVKKTRQV